MSNYKTIIGITVIAIIILFFINKENIVIIGENIIKVEYAISAEERMIGLSGREYLDYNSGMLFFFEYEKKHGFWMKETLIPLDVIWINADKEIVYIKHNIQPESYPEVFYPNMDAMYALELNGGYSKINSIKIGDLTEF